MISETQAEEIRVAAGELVSAEKVMNYTTGIRKFDGETYKLHADQIGTKSAAVEMKKFMKTEGHKARITKLDGKYALWISRRYK
jgi:hypothetical protein